MTAESKAGADVARVRASLRAEVPRFYHASLHLGFSAAVSLGVAFGLVAGIHELRLAELACVPAFFVFCTLCEYLGHRYLLHRSSWIGRFTYQKHTLRHHRFYTDEQFRPQSQRDFAYILFPPAGVLVYMLIAVCPFVALFTLAVSRNAGRLVGATSAVFFLLYELVHLASHFGDRRSAGGSWRRTMSQHHRIHHRVDLMTRCNFNIVAPIFDEVFGTRRRE